ncbi:hypothetical protein BP5796_11352 [Coleophoma crateriformis]|uniref:Uncharacterized protein n=1 Tax=Coleophoma crateriformis TaxID=565419 RepID=A0A3D8QIG8_9HELO|nr:hypothetical protein BP5796_11352 [Coleophoma crateriformis]
MGQNLSSTKINDTALDVVAAPDALNDLHLGIFFGGSFYAIGMIWFTIALIDRWRGPNGDRKTGFASVIAAFILITLIPDQSGYCSESGTPYASDYGPFPDWDISDQSDADALTLTGCTAFGVNIRVHNDTIDSIELNGVRSVRSLNVSSSAALASFQAPNLTMINGSFTLYDLPNLTIVDLPAFEYAVIVDWSNLPVVWEVASWTSNAITNALSIRNTSLLNIAFSGGSSNSSEAQPVDQYYSELIITENRHLEYINLPNITHIESCNISGNDGYLQTIDLSGLTYTGAMFLSKAPLELRFPKLESVTGTFDLSNSPDLFELDLNALENVYGTFSLVGNKGLTTLNVSSLQTTDSLVMENNRIAAFEFPSLTSSTEISIEGQFNSIDFSKHYSSFDGPVNITSVSETLNCTALDIIHYHTIDFEGTNFNYTCRASPMGDTRDFAVHFHYISAKSAKTKRIIIGCVVLTLAIFLGLLLWWRRSRKRTAAAAARENGTAESGMELPPRYRRTGLEGEIPPAYNVGGSTSSVQSAEIPNRVAPGEPTPNYEESRH